MTNLNLFGKALARHSCKQGKQTGHLMLLLVGKNGQFVNKFSSWIIDHLKTRKPWF